MEVSNERLLSSSIKSGNKDKIRYAFEKIYNDYVILVAFYIGKYISNQETIKDLTNDVFVSFFNNASNINGSIKFYLLKSSRNKCLNYLKKERNITLVEYDDLFFETNNFESHYSYKELVADLTSVLDEKSVRIIIMHAVEGYTFKEIASVLNLNYKTVNKIYERAIKKYREVSK